MGVVRSAALSGTYSTNPYEFHHHNVNSVQVLINGQESAIGNYTPDFARNHYTNEYLSLFRGKNRLNMDFGNDLTLFDYAGGSTFYMFHLQPQVSEGDEGSFWPLRTQGNVRIQIRFAEALEESVTILVLARSPTYFSIDQSRNIIKSL